MKKQFFRVKQLADQTFLRAEKSKQLSDELQDADQKVEFLRVALSAVSKRLPQCNNSTQEKENLDKRLRKLIEYQLGTVMQEYGCKKDELSEHDVSLLKPILHKCGKAQVELAREMTEHEIKIESMVSAPIQVVLENDIPAILKTKRTLSKLVLDKDSATNRYQTASKHGTKNESIRDEMEEAEQKVEYCRDSLAAEMFSLLRRESDFAQYMLQLIKLQRAYHESALHTLEYLIPELEKEVGDSPVKAVYGCPLEEHLRLSKRQIALPLELCICALWELGMNEEGLFRVAGGTSRVRRMKLSLDSGCFSPPLQLEYRDVHVIASALKSYLRELPEPLLTYGLYDDWIRAAKLLNEEQRIEAISNVLSRLPGTNYDNLRYLIIFLAELSKNPSNKMTSSNIAIVMAPNLLWSVQEINNGIDMSSATIVNGIVEMLVSHVDRFFPGAGEQLHVYGTFKRDDLFPDLTEFERPSIAHHLRSSSNDTALIHLDPVAVIDVANNLPASVVDRNSSPPHGSPKPVSRKKNKPAPIPPAIALTTTNTNTKESAANIIVNVDNKPPKPTQYQYPSGSSTINRTTYKQQKANHEHDTINGKSNNNKMSVSVGTADEFNSLNRRKSLDFDHHQLNAISAVKNNVPLKKSSDLHINKSDISFPISTETTANIESLKSAEVSCVMPLPSTTTVPTNHIHTLQSTNIHQITAQNVTVGKIKVTVDSLQQKSQINVPPPPPVTATIADQKNIIINNINNNNNNGGGGQTKVMPVAAPRTSLLEGQKTSPVNLNNSQSISSRSLNEIDCDGELVQLRRASRDEFLNRPNKPVVPERPATLRPSSFRVSKQGALSSVSDTATIINNENSAAVAAAAAAAAALERTHVYNVADKQQVSFVQFQQQQREREKGHDTQMAEKEKFLMSNNYMNIELKSQVPTPRHALEANKLVTDKSDVNFNNTNAGEESCSSSSNLVRTLSIGSRNNPNYTNFNMSSASGSFASVAGGNRPPKPDVLKSLERLNIESSNGNLHGTEQRKYHHSHNRERHHHMRTLSDGNLIDSISLGVDSALSPRSPTGPPPSPRGTVRPPRPQPPPPPPPVRPKSEGESTDL